MKVISKIKTIFPDIVIKCLGSVCDTRQIDSSHVKMQLIMKLMKRYEIKFQPLGGATNRISFMINGYAVKIALDRQGYKDNLMEYSLSPELQPFVSKSYETNGYILIAECVRVMTEDDFIIRKSDMLKILDVLSQDYLLGDVGYIKKNFTNWGIRDDGGAVILDYAYCHRATENLFTCKVCGSGILRYDSTFSFLKCNNATVCTAKYDYTEIKLVQGNEVDLELINEAKDNSLLLHGDKNYIEVEVDDNDGNLSDTNVLVINTKEALQLYEKEIKKNMDMERLSKLNLERMFAKTPEERQAVQKKIDALFEENRKNYEESINRRVVINVSEEEDHCDEEEDFVDQEKPEVPAFDLVSAMRRMMMQDESQYFQDASDADDYKLNPEEAPETIPMRIGFRSSDEEDIPNDNDCEQGESNVSESEETNELPTLNAKFIITGEDVTNNDDKTYNKPVERGIFVNGIRVIEGGK